MHKTAKFKGECWLWPYAVNAQGYGKVQSNKKVYDAHKWLFELIKGEVPHKTELDHICRNRLCVNPEHLQPISHAENCRRGSNAKLTENDVKKIRSLFGQKNQREIAEMFGVSRATIGLIFQGKRWV